MIATFSSTALDLQWERILINFVGMYFLKCSIALWRHSMRFTISPVFVISFMYRTTENKQANKRFFVYFGSCTNEKHSGNNRLCSQPMRTPIRWTFKVHGYKFTKNIRIIWSFYFFLVISRRSNSLSKNPQLHQSQELRSDDHLQNVFQTSAIWRNQEELYPRDCWKTARFFKDRVHFGEARHAEALELLDSWRKFLHKRNGSPYR